MSTENLKSPGESFQQSDPIGFIHLSSVGVHLWNFARRKSNDLKNRDTDFVEQKILYKMKIK
jgi:hypothetical protein